jgi:hypothetical protein
MDMVVVHAQRREGNSTRALIGRPLGGWLDSVQHLKKGLKERGEFGIKHCSLMLVAAFCGCDESEGCV